MLLQSEISSSSRNVHLQPKSAGWVEVITGSMFSGKTEELLRRVRRALIAKQTCLLVKPVTDSRYSEDHVVSHDQERLPCVSLQKASEILSMAEPYSVVAVDEAQFFEQDLVEVCNRLADQGKRVIVAGLDQDYRGLPFDPMPELMASAEYVTKQLAICIQCGGPAIKNQRVVSSPERVLVGAANLYEARCRRCYEPPNPD